MEINEVIRSSELSELCAAVKDLVAHKEYDKCVELISSAMQAYPHAPQPHNLMGLVMEKIGQHTSAMKHFRAAWALDPTYYPANENLLTYGTFYSGGKDVYDEGDSRKAKPVHYDIEYDCRGIGHAVRRK